MKRLGTIGIVLLTSASLWACGGSQDQGTTTTTGAGDNQPGYDKPVELDVVFQFMKDDDVPELDVFVEREPGSGEVYRLSKGVRDMSTPLYATDGPVIRDPYDPDKLGPFPKGKELGVTAGEYFDADGRGKYSCHDGTGKLNLEFTKLVPNSVYTIWHSFYPWPPTKPFSSYDMPLGARDGSDAMFHTDAEGNASFELEFKPCLQLSGEYLMSDLSLAWHSDGQTYGDKPGEFGTVTHVQMYSLMPKRTGI